MGYIDSGKQEGATLHMGAIASLLGVSDLELYGPAETPEGKREKG